MEDGASGAVVRAPPNRANVTRPQSGKRFTALQPVRQRRLRRRVPHLRELSLRRGKGRRVTLRTDPTQDRRDRYGRLLAYVRRRGGAELGARQLRAGWATTYVYDRPFRRLRRYRRAERSAKARNRGVWRRCGGNFHTPA